MSSTTVSLIPYGSEELSEIEQEALKKLRIVIDRSGDPLLHNKLDTTDENLLMFLRCRNYDIDSAFARLQRNVQIRTKKYPEVFDRIYPSALYKAFEAQAGGVLKNRDAFGRHVCYLKASAWDLDVLTVEEVCQAIVMIGYEIRKFKETQTNGIVLLLDTSGFSYKMAKQANPLILQKYVSIMLHASPLKIKGLHICNAGYVFDISFSVLKMILPRKICKRIHFHGGSLKSLHEFVPTEILPDIFGGKLTEFDAIDQDLINGIYSPEKDEYYKTMIANYKSL